MSEIIEDNTPEYDVIRICAIFKMKSFDFDIENTLKSVGETFHDVEYHDKENIFYIRQSIHSMFALRSMKNKDIVKYIIDKLKAYLSVTNITIIEQRLPLDEVRYQLKES